MLVEKIKQSASELFEFFRSESPYQQANKGWLAENIYLKLKPEKDSSKELDQIVEISFYSKPIFQMLVTLFFVICLAMTFAFSPLYLMN